MRFIVNWEKGEGEIERKGEVITLIVKRQKNKLN